MLVWTSRAYTIFQQLTWWWEPNSAHTPPPLPGPPVWSKNAWVHQLHLGPEFTWHYGSSFLCSDTENHLTRSKDNPQAVSLSSPTCCSAEAGIFIVGIKKASGNFSCCSSRPCSAGSHWAAYTLLWIKSGTAQGSVTRDHQPDLTAGAAGSPSLLQHLQTCKDLSQDHLGGGPGVLMTNRRLLSLWQKAKKWNSFGACSSKYPGLPRSREKEKELHENCSPAVQRRDRDHLAKHQTATLNTQQGSWRASPTPLDTKQVTVQRASSLALLPVPAQAPDRFLRGGSLLTCQHQLPSPDPVNESEQSPHHCTRSTCTYSTLSSSRPLSLSHSSVLL